MIRLFGALIDRVCAVVGALLFAQAPLFMQQYSQQLIGREAELRFQVAEMQRVASISGKTLELFISKFIKNSDPDIVLQGELMQKTVDRWHQFADALTALQSSSILERPFVFLSHLNAETFKSTLNHFTFGFPLTIEGGCYALIGIVTGYCVFACVRMIFRKLAVVCHLQKA